MNKLFKILLFSISFIPANNSFGAPCCLQPFEQRLYADKHQHECSTCDECESSCECSRTDDDCIEEFHATKMLSLSTNYLSNIFKIPFPPLVYGVIWQPPKIK